MPNQRFVLLVSSPEDNSFDPPAVFGPFTQAEAVSFAEDFREANGLPREASAENNEAWTDAGWYFGIFEMKDKIEKWILPK